MDRTLDEKNQEFGATPKYRIPKVSGKTPQNEALVVREPDEQPAAEAAAQAAEQKEGGTSNHPRVMRGGRSARRRGMGAGRGGIERSHAQAQIAMSSLKSAINCKNITIGNLSLNIGQSAGGFANREQRNSYYRRARRGRGMAGRGGGERGGARGNRGGGGTRGGRGGFRGGRGEGRGGKGRG